MFRLSSSLCPFCEARALGRAVAAAPRWHTQQQQQLRNAATMQKRRPSRMILSPNVRKGPPSPDVSTGRRPARQRDQVRGPFGGMNVARVPRDIQATQERERRSEEESEQQPRRDNRRSPARGGRQSAKKHRDPMKALKMQRALSNTPYEKRSAVKEAIQKHDAFESFDLLSVIKDSIQSQALGGLVQISPTPIQRLAIPVLLDPKNRRHPKYSGLTEEFQQFLLAAETGSGKTLAYLLPVIDALKRDEAVERAREAKEGSRQEREKAEISRYKMFGIEPPEVKEPDKDTARPRAIILLPTAELVDQVGHLVKSMSHTVKFRAAVLSANYTAKVIRSRMFSQGGIDVVISTPHLLNSIASSDPNILSRVSHLVIDEADSLYDRSFAPITTSIVDRVSPSLRKLILCSATIPRNLDSFLQKRYPAIRRLSTPNLHAIPRRVQLSVVDIEKIPFQGNRDLACAQTIFDIGKDTTTGESEEQSFAKDRWSPASENNNNNKEKKIVVFVNEREKAAELAQYLVSKGIDAFALARDSEDRGQAQLLAEFTGLTAREKTTVTPSKESREKEEDEERGLSDFDSAPASAQKTVAHPPSARRQLPNTKVLVMTDLGSRGIDTLPVRHVVLYDVPHTSIDFIHRLGRVGRMGRRGRGVVLVGRHDRKDVVKEVREGMFRGQALI